MEFNRFDGLEKSYTGGKLFVYILVLAVMGSISASMGRIWPILLAVIAVVDIHFSNLKRVKEIIELYPPAHRDDKILINQDGIGVFFADGGKLFTRWEDVVQIERNDLSFGIRIYITNIRSESIWWFSYREKSLEYILEMRPDLKPLLKNTSGPRPKKR